MNLPVHRIKRAPEVFSNGLDIGHGCTLTVRLAARQRRLADWLLRWGGAGASRSGIYDRTRVTPVTGRDVPNSERAKRQSTSRNHKHRDAEQGPRDAHGAQRTPRRSRPFVVAGVANGTSELAVLPEHARTTTMTAIAPNAAGVAHASKPKRRTLYD
jgi:hypothetical protein